jgi:hypothetical protein
MKVYAFNLRQLHNLVYIYLCLLHLRDFMGSLARRTMIEHSTEGECLKRQVTKLKPRANLRGPRFL